MYTYLGVYFKKADESDRKDRSYIADGIGDAKRFVYNYLWSNASVERVSSNLYISAAVIDYFVGSLFNGKIGTRIIKPVGFLYRGMFNKKENFAVIMPDELTKRQFDYNLDYILMEENVLWTRNALIALDEIRPRPRGPVYIGSIDAFKESKVYPLIEELPTK